MMKKILILILTIIFTSNIFSAVTYAATAEEKAAKKEAKLEKKRAKQIAKQAKKNNFVKLQQMADEGDVQALIILAYAYEKGEQGMKRLPKMVKVLKSKAAKKAPDLVENFIPTEYGKRRIQLSRMYGLAASHARLRDYPGATDDDTIKWAEMGVAEQDSLSLAILGAAYYTGRGVGQDYKVAVSYFKQAGTDFLALQLLADAYKNGNGVDKDLRKSKIYSDYLQLLKQKIKKKIKQY